MHKFILNFCYFCLSLTALEMINYTKDYYELKNLNNYLKYDLKNNEVEDFSNEQYTFKIIENNNEIKYVIEMKRNSLFKISELKTITYYDTIINGDNNDS